MKHYNSIPHYYDSPLRDEKVIAFDKLDGSNLRFEWNAKRGFYKFGARQEMRSITDPTFGPAFVHFVNKYTSEIDKVFLSKKYSRIQNFVCFAEYHGANSEFGEHIPGEPFDVVLFDVNAYKKGLIFPQEFVDDFGHLGIPKIVYEGIMDDEFIEDVKNNKFGLREGVICKAVLKSKKGNSMIEYCKVKTNDWRDRLRTKKGQAAVDKEFGKNN